MVHNLVHWRTPYGTQLVRSGTFSLRIWYASKNPNGNTVLLFRGSERLGGGAGLVPFSECFFDGIGVYVPVTHCFIKKKCFKLVSRISKQGIQCECDQLKIEMCAKMSRSFIAKLEDD